MFLIKLEMDRNAPLVRQMTADCQKMHQFVTGLFGTSRQTSQILYRTNMVKGKFYAYLYAQRPVVNIPEGCSIQQKDISSWLKQMEAGQVWNFDLVASPSKKVSENTKNSRRKVLKDPSERQAWLERKAEQNGFAILHAEEREHIQASGKHADDNGGAMYHSAYHYQGVLKIVDADAFRKGLQNGIGPGKAYGFGMMMVKVG